MRDRLLRALPYLLTATVAYVALTWAIGHVLPPPYSGYLAVVVVGLVATELYKRRPDQRARRLLRIYLGAREGGAQEAAAREQLLVRVYRAASARSLVATDVERAWIGRSERERVLAGVAVLLERQGVRVDGAILGPAWDLERDRVVIPGWDALPPEFVDEVRQRLDERERAELEALVDGYRLFTQNFFQRASGLGADPRGAVADFARLLQSVGNQLAKEHPGDGERAYRLSLALRPDLNLAHAGLALLLARSGRTREAGHEARIALEVLDAYARQASERTPPAEDIFPFRAPADLRAAVERVAAGR